VTAETGLARLASRMRGSGPLTLHAWGRMTPAVTAVQSNLRRYTAWPIKVVLQPAVSDGTSNTIMIAEKGAVLRRVGLVHLPRRPARDPSPPALHAARSRAGLPGRRAHQRVRRARARRRSSTLQCVRGLDNGRFFSSGRDALPHVLDRRPDAASARLRTASHGGRGSARPARIAAAGRAGSAAPTLGPTDSEGCWEY
jgi:hypothetical protein